LPFFYFSPFFRVQPARRTFRLAQVVCFGHLRARVFLPGVRRRSRWGEDLVPFVSFFWVRAFSPMFVDFWRFFIAFSGLLSVSGPRCSMMRLAGLFADFSLFSNLRPARSLFRPVRCRSLRVCGWSRGFSGFANKRDCGVLGLVFARDVGWFVFLLSPGPVS
jgi:hypothetical protein